MDNEGLVHITVKSDNRIMTISSCERYQLINRPARKWHYLGPNVLPIHKACSGSWSNYLMYKKEDCSFALTNNESNAFGLLRRALIMKSRKRCRKGPVFPMWECCACVLSHAGTFFPRISLILGVYGIMWRQVKCQKIRPIWSTLLSPRK